MLFYIIVALELNTLLVLYLIHISIKYILNHAAYIYHAGWLKGKMVRVRHILFFHILYRFQIFYILFILNL